MLTSPKARSAPKFRSVRERMDAGKALRDRVPRSSHAKWTAPKDRPDPIELIRHADQGRVAELLPIRYERMRCSPFAFFRGTAALMASDLAKTPATGTLVQACGDCHLANFGGFASPERTLLFDINDFDETLRAPWEWDLKRLAVSLVLSGREIGASKSQCAKAVESVARSYRLRMRDYAEMRALETWYSHVEAKVLIEDAETPASRKYWKVQEHEAQLRTQERVFKKMTTLENGQRRIIDNRPLVFHPSKRAAFVDEVHKLFVRYRETLPVERRVVLDRYHFTDAAIKVVGVGAVGTRCGVVLLMAEKNDPLVLQYKEAQTSALQPYCGPCRYDNHAERVVIGQRMLQAASDVFLGWTRDDRGRDFYFRQLRDMKMALEIDTMPIADWLELARVCGWTLARGHARTGDSAMISGYLGKKEVFDEATRDFAFLYAGQVEKDYRLFLKRGPKK